MTNNGFTTISSNFIHLFDLHTKYHTTDIKCSSPRYLFWNVSCFSFIWNDWLIQFMNLVVNIAFICWSKSFIPLFIWLEHQFFRDGYETIGDSLIFHMSSWLVDALSFILIKKDLNKSYFSFPDTQLLSRNYFIFFRIWLEGLSEFTLCFKSFTLIDNSTIFNYLVTNMKCFALHDSNESIP